MSTWTWTRLPLSLAVIVLCGCVPTPDEVATSSDVIGSSTGASTGPGSMSSVTMPGDESMGTQGGTSAGTTMSADTTAGVSASDGTTSVDPGTSSGGAENSSGPPPDPDCEDDDQCANNQICNDMGMCVDACGGTWAPDGNYAACINEYGGTDVGGLCGGGNHDCIVDDFPVSGSTCSRQSCSDVCDCPAPVAGSNATVTCQDITGDATNDCYLSCADGETCPAGMECFENIVCLTPVPDPIPVYGNCDGLVPDCEAGAFCLNGPGTTSVCQEGCSGPGDCPAPPPTGNAPVTCGLANPDHGGNECYLDCNSGQTCPVGMFCYNGYICAFP